MSPRISSPDDLRLINACLNGDEQAWEALIDKYKRLIYAIILKYRMSEDDSGDIFQAVCVDLFNDLGKLRKAEAIRGWLARVTANKCFHWKRKENQRPQQGLDESIAEPGVELPEWIEAVERDQIVRDAVASLNPRCQELLHLLFYEDPPRPYELVARQLSLAAGSIGFIRGRCLKKLQVKLEELGL